MGCAAMKVYYNENDHGAAEWLRHLIRDGLIAHGDVDERSIIDVKGQDLKGYDQCHFFAGGGGGPWLSNSPDMPIFDLFGQVVPHANHSAAPEPEPANQMSGTYGRILQGSSMSGALQSSLESKFMRLLPMDGLMTHSAIWRHRNTPARRRYCRHIVPEQTLKEIGFISVPRPLASDYRDRGHVGNPSIQRRMRLGKQLHLSQLFKGVPCPSCVLAIMGYPLKWLISLIK